MKRLLASLLAASASLTAACGAGSENASPPTITSGEDVVRAMHDRYGDQWYHTLRFRQNVVRTAADGSSPPDEVWLEHLDIPGRLRIDQATAYDGNGVLYAGDSLFVFREGALTRSLARRNPLLVLGFDVYRQPVERTTAILAEEGFDLSTVRADRWQDRDVWVVGAPAGDLHTAQFWVDAERLLFVRVLEPANADGTGTQDIRFDDYRPLAGGWISPTVRFLVDDTEVMREEYFDVEADPELPAGLFEPARWSEAGSR